jgi:hypothetical protein
MEQLVFVRTEQVVRYIAQSVHHPTIKAEGSTEAEALERLRQALKERLGTDVECKKLPVADPANPLLAHIGASADDPQWEMFQEEVRRAREADPIE